MLFKKSPKMALNSKQNNRKTENTHRQKTSFLKSKQKMLTYINPY